MSYLNKPVAYLQVTDFDDSGNLINPKIPKDIPVVIMAQASWCGHCTHAKPDFQAFANENQGKVFAATIQNDGKEKGEPELAKKLNTFFPKLRGFPSYFGYKNGKFIKEHTGGRDKASLQQFAMSL